MQHQVAIVGAGVSGLTCGIAFAERGHRTTIFAKKIGQQTTSGAAAALWFPYDVEPADKVIPWALETCRTLIDLARGPDSGVSLIELRQFSRTGKIAIPDWATSLGARRLSAVATALRRRADGSRGKRLETARRRQHFKSGFSLRVPLMDTTIYLDHLVNRFLKADGQITENVRFEKLEHVNPKFDLVINCAGIGARELVQDADLEPHRGQVAIVPRIEDLPYAVVCDDTPLMYAIPRTNDCVFGGTNELSDNLAVDDATTTRIVAECARTLGIEKPNVLVERVGLRPFRKAGVRVERAGLSDGRTVIHNYGHGGAGFTLSWGCAAEVFRLATTVLDSAGA
ncbi:MAG TPA: FAD-dependent oxidoreductase [Candidatus Udaeobacter sp.]|nr:FAD-dependent oxidoreductase [Candidatus Udaeobacter sp.]